MNPGQTAATVTPAAPAAIHPSTGTTSDDSSLDASPDNINAPRPPMQRQIINLVLIMAAIVVPFLVFDARGALFMVLALMAIIMFHEFCHFFVARLCGMKVTEFFLGFGPRLWSVRRGDTEYGIKAIPAGGYVKIIGMSSLDVVPGSDEARTYRQQSWAKRVATIAAGPASHFFLAFWLLIAYFAWAGQPVGIQPQVGSVLVGSPAQQAGLLPGDRILSINGSPVRFFDDVATQIADHSGEALPVVVDRAGSTRTLTITPRVIADADAIRRPRIGVAASGTYVTERTSVAGAFPKAFGELGNSTRLTFEGIRGLVKPDRLRSYMSQVKSANTATGPVTQVEAETRPTSIIGMVQIGGDAAGRSKSELLLILVAINLGLGMFNLLPMLPLDGGHIVLATWEAIVSRAKGRRHFADMTKVMPFAAAFLAVLLVLGVSAMYLDVVRPL